MNNNKNILKGSIIASALIAAAGFNANASGLFRYSNLGSGTEVRTSLLAKGNSAKTFELTCGKDSTSMKKGKDGKCGEGKCGDKKKMDKKAMKGKAKDGKCGEGKCGDSTKMKKS